MTPTTKSVTERAPARAETQDDFTDPLEQSAHEKNRDLRERYIELTERSTDPKADQKKIARQRDLIGEQFIVLNSPFATSLVTKVARPQDDREDLYEEALVTMWEHFLTWDPAKAHFTTYAYYSILGDVGRARVRSHGEGSYGDHQARSRTLAAASQLNASLGRKPTIDELVTETQLTADTVRRVLRPTSTSLSRPVGHEGSVTTLGELLADTRTTPSSSLEDLWLSRLKEATKGLSMQDTLIVLRRRGLDGWPAETLQQVGKWLGLGREPVRRAEAAADAMFLKNGTPLPSAD